RPPATTASSRRRAAGPRRSWAGARAEAVADAGRTAGDWPSDSPGLGVCLPGSATLGVGFVRILLHRVSPRPEVPQNPRGDVAPGPVAVVFQSVPDRGVGTDRLPGAAASDGGRGGAVLAGRAVAADAARAVADQSLAGMGGTAAQTAGRGPSRETCPTRK